MSQLTISNPHSILEALKYRPEQVLKVTIPSQTNEYWDAVRILAREKNVSISERGRGGAAIRPVSSVSLEDLLQRRTDANDLFLVLDCIQDPHNLGAILRTASFFGVRGVILSRERSAPLTEVVYDVASGGVETVPHCVEKNIARALDKLKKSGIWILGTSEHEEGATFSGLSLDRDWAVVLGNEEKGIRRLVKEHCDVLVGVPPRGGVSSLNVSVAAGVVLSKLAFSE